VYVELARAPDRADGRSFQSKVQGNIDWEVPGRQLDLAAWPTDQPDRFRSASSIVRSVATLVII
jgi:hypothetical protein